MEFSRGDLIKNLNTDELYVVIQYNSCEDNYYDNMGIVLEKDLTNFIETQDSKYITVVSNDDDWDISEYKLVQSTKYEIEQKIEYVLKNDNIHNRFRVGDIVKHFKYETLSEEEKKEHKYLYKILAFAKHTEKDETFVIYQALYGNFETFARPMEMFNERLDKQQYPNIKSKYRFNKVY